MHSQIGTKQPKNMLQTTQIGPKYDLITQMRPEKALNQPNQAKKLPKIGLILPHSSKIAPK